MKILVLSQYWHPENGVPQRRWAWLSKILVDAGHEVTVIAPPPHYQRKMSMQEWWKNRRSRYRRVTEPNIGPSGERIIRSGFFPAGPSLTQRVFNQATVTLSMTWAILRKPGELKNYKPDLIIGTVPALPMAVATTFAARRFGTPSIIDLRDAWPDLLQQSAHWNEVTGRTSIREKLLRKGPLQLVKSLTRRALNDSLRKADGIIVTSSDLAEDLSRRSELMVGPTPPNTVTIRNVFPVETRFNKSPRKTVLSDQLNVLYAGTLGRAQDLGNALEAASLARQMGANVRLRLIGAGVAKPALRIFAAEQNLDVSFEDRRPANELVELYEWADTALVHLADWKPLSMAVPSKTYELMSVGMHISGVLSGEAAGMIEKYSAGHAVHPGEPRALAELWVALSNDRTMLDVGDEARRWVETERVDRSPVTLLKLVEDLAG